MISKDKERKGDAGEGATVYGCSSQVNQVNLVIRQYVIRAIHNMQCIMGRIKFLLDSRCKIYAWHDNAWENRNLCHRHYMRLNLGILCLLINWTLKLFVNGCHISEITHLYKNNKNGGDGPRECSVLRYSLLHPVFMNNAFISTFSLPQRNSILDILQFWWKNWQKNPKKPKHWVKGTKSSIIWCSWYAVSLPDHPVTLIPSQQCVSVSGCNWWEIWTNVSYASSDTSNVGTR